MLEKGSFKKKDHVKKACGETDGDHDEVNQDDEDDGDDGDDDNDDGNCGGVGGRCCRR